ncbi:MAG: hypothetical protein IT572_00485 [Deltaproteobacteria bacterium]|nr:hypothetical protein [Deltaproteobacteria bacterium]
MKPTQSWHAVGSAPGGDIYVAGMDHKKNSALYRLETKVGLLRYVGDARAAAESAGNFRPDDQFEKFHTRPLWHRGRVYLANLNRSYGNEEWRRVRGFHWFAYGVAQDSFLDLSAAEPGGSAAEHGGLVSLVSDPSREVLYGAQAPEGRIYRFDPARNKTEDLGRPLGLKQPYVYAARALWIDARGRLYYTMGKGWYTQGKDDLSVTGHVHVYDPDSGWTERRDWKLAPPLVRGVHDAIEVGQWTLDRKTFFMADDRLRVYRFDEEGPSFTYIGHADYGGGDNWVWQVAPNGKKAYFAPSDPAEGLFEYDLEKKTTRKLAGLDELDPAVGSLGRHTGYDAWDQDGRFYLASFQRDGNQNAILTAVDPVRLKVAKGLLPSLQRVGIRTKGDGFEVFREGGVQGKLEVLYSTWQGEESFDGALSSLGRVLIPEGQASVELEPKKLPLQAVGDKKTQIRLLADGDTYVLGERILVERFTN